MEHDYRLELLAKVFSKHADKTDEEWEKHQVKYDLDDEELETILSFNLSRALSVMAEEIQKLKLEIRNLKIVKTCS